MRTRIPLAAPALDLISVPFSLSDCPSRYLLTDNYADRGRIGKRKSAQPPVQYGKTCVAGVSQRRCLAAEFTPDVSILTTLASLDLSESGMDWKTERCSSSGGFRKGLWSKNFSNATPGCGVDPRFVPTILPSLHGPLGHPHVRAYIHGCPAPARSAHQRDKHLAPAAVSSTAVDA